MGYYFQKFNIFKRGGGGEVVYNLDLMYLLGKGTGYIWKTKLVFGCHKLVKEKDT